VLAIIAVNAPHQSNEAPCLNRLFNTRLSASATVVDFVYTTALQLQHPIVTTFAAASSLPLLGKVVAAFAGATC
jgi:hypothetical protein